jgi:hypothetical protein
MPPDVPQKAITFEYPITPPEGTTCWRIHENNGVDYFFRPMDFNICSLPFTYRLTLGIDSGVPPIDYSLQSIGKGWAMANRGTNWFIKRL